MEIHPEKCTGCRQCVPYCPVGAIKAVEQISTINQEECVECGACLKSGVCPSGAIYRTKLEWPRTLRYQFSDPLGVHPGTKTSGRGTDEMKTNDTSARFRLGEIGLGIEMGRPGIGATFNDLEKVATAIAKLGVEFEPVNPVTQLLDTATGKLKYPEVGSERVLSAIIECKIREEAVITLLKVLHQVAEEIDTVFSVSLISRCQGTTIPVLSRLTAAGFAPRINGKINMGLGRPLRP